MPAISAGTRLGPYEVLDSLGSGGMGEVYRARDARLNRTVAIKVLTAAGAGDPEHRARFEREAKAVAMLDHPHVCGIYDFGDADGVHYLVMPQLEGETLAARLERGALPLDLALRIAGDVADALQAAHRVGVVHRDLKPANIFLVRRSGTSTPDARLLDFGLAKLRTTSGAIAISAIEQGATTKATAEGTILGTVQYMSPEQVEGRDADARADIWALGVVIYEMVTGTRPFTGQSSASILGAILKDTPAPLSSRQPLSPAALDQLVAVCLAKNPEERWQSAADLKRQLEWIAHKGSVGTPTVPPVAHRSLGTRALPVAAALIIGAAGAWVVANRTHSSTVLPGEPILFTLEAPPGTAFAGPPASTTVPQLVLSPDGRHLVFLVSDEQQQSHLWIRTLDSPVPRRLEGTEGAGDPFWSPDSKRVGFFSRGNLLTTEIDGGSSPRTLARVLIDSRGGAWGDDGSILFYNGKAAELSRVAATGGEVTTFPFAGAPGVVRRAEFLPHGNALLFQLRNDEAGRRGIYVAPGGGGAAHRLVGTDWAGHYGSGHLLFLDNSMLMAQPFDASSLELHGAPTPIAQGIGASSTGYGAFSVSTTGVLAYTGPLASQSEIRWVARDGAVGGVVIPQGDYVDLSFSPDEKQIAYSLVDPATQSPDIWILDVARGTSSRITSERLVDASPIWSPNGEDIVFRSNRSSTLGVEMFRTTARPGGRSERIWSTENAAATGTPSNLIPCAWLPDGHIVFYQATIERGYGIWSISIADKTSAAIIDSNANELQAAISPDGRWMAYASDQSGRFEIYVQDFPKGLERTLISTKGGLEPKWRGDGRELFYLQSDGTLMGVAIKTGTRLEASAPTPLFKTAIPTLNPYRMDYVPAADGRRFLMKVPVSKRTPVITVVVNWPALLQKN